MQMDVELDTGDMLLRVACPITLTDTGVTLHDKLAELGAGCILDALRQLQEGRLNPVRQDETAATYAAKLLKSEGQIDWKLDAGQIERAVRAFNPFPACHATLGDAVIKIWQASVVLQQGEPGMVLAADKQGITVACGDGALRLEVLQRPGSKAQPAVQFMQAVPVRVGDKFTVN
jgi:methionyl-tRNA formyltransferase